jgi:hypothetical protein
MVEFFKRYVGNRYRYELDSLLIHVRVIDVRTYYGRTQVCITPATDGSGSKWVNVESLGREVTQ